MISRNPMISIAVSFASTIILGAAPIASADYSLVAFQSQDKNLMVAEAHQHGEGKGNDGKHGEGNCCGGMMGSMKGMMKHEHSYAHMIASHADALKLSDTQLGQIVRLHIKHTQEHEQFKQIIHKSMMEFHQEGMKLGTDDATLRKLGKDHAKAFNAMIEQHIRDRNAVNSILSADQRNQLKTLKMDHGMQGGDHGQH